MSDRVRILFNTLVLYALTLGLGILAAWRHAMQPDRAALPTVAFGFQDAVIFFLVFTVFTLAMVRFARAARASLGIFLIITLLAGAHFVASAWLPWAPALAVAIGIALLRKHWPTVVVHDLAIVVGIAGIAALLGRSLNPLWAAGLLALLSIYDVISVYRTKHMVALAGRMMESGAIFGFLVPASAREFTMPVQDALERRSVMVLGSGDIGLPLVLAASSVATSVNAAIVVAGFSLVGVMAMQWLFTHQEKPMPMAALPPIAALAVLGYVVATLLGL